ncbi:MAG: hypothetical protein JSV51_01135, partial [Candidatus Bathyarchaeota archaeon]
SSRIKKSRRNLPEEDLYPSVQVKVSEERLDEILGTFSLKDTPLEERRKEAKKPLYLVRYE